LCFVLYAPSATPASDKQGLRPLPNNINGFEVVAIRTEKHMLTAENAENAEKELDIKFKTKNYKLNSAVSASSAVKMMILLSFAPKA